MRATGVRDSSPPCEKPLSQRLRVVNFSLTFRCNYACRCCYQRSELPETDSRGALELVDALGRLGVQTLMIGGGEPLLRSDLPAIVRRASELGIATYIGSNGSLLDEATGRALREAHLSKFFLGMDDPLAPGAKDGSPERYREALGLLRRLGIPAAINLIVTRELAGRFEETLLCLKEMGAEHVNLLRPRPDAAGTWLPSVRLGPSELAGLRDRRLELCERHQMLLSLDCALGALMHGTREPEFFQDIVSCSAGISYFHMDPLGHVYPCPYLTGPEFSMGHLMDPSFLERWETDPLLAKLRDRDRLGGKCGACAYRRSCGGCRALALHDHGDLLAEDPDCPF
jgi:radical SAM protein with 4Fe4S-binding SPASM domain